MPTANEKYLIVRFSILPVITYQPMLYQHAGCWTPGIVQRQLPCTDDPSFCSKIELCSWKRDESSSRYMCSTLVLRHGSIHLSHIHKRLAVHLSKRNDHNQSVGVRTCTLGALVAKEWDEYVTCCDLHSIAMTTSMPLLALAHDDIRVSNSGSMFDLRLRRRRRQTRSLD